MTPSAAASLLVVNPSHPLCWLASPGPGFPFVCHPVLLVDGVLSYPHPTDDSGGWIAVPSDAEISLDGTDGIHHLTHGGVTLPIARVDPWVDPGDHSERAFFQGQEGYVFRGCDGVDRLALDAEAHDAKGNVHAICTAPASRAGLLDPGQMSAYGRAFAYLI